MSRPKPVTPFVEPSSSSPRNTLRFAERTFVGYGWPEADSRWLGQLLLGVLPPSGSTATKLSEHSEAHFHMLALAWFNAKEPPLSGSLAPAHRDRALICMLATLMHAVWTPRLLVPIDAGDTEPWAVPEEVAIDLVRTMQQHAADFRAALRNGWPTHLSREFADPDTALRLRGRERLTVALLRAGSIDADDAKTLLTPAPRAEADANAVTAEEHTRKEPDSIEHSRAVRAVDGESNLFVMSLLEGYVQRIQRTDLRLIAEQVVRGGHAAVAAQLALARAAPRSDVAAIVGIIAHAAAGRLVHSETASHYERFDPRTQLDTERMVAFARAMRPFFEILDEHVGEQPLACDADLRSTWMYLFRMAWDAEFADCPSDLRSKMLAAAAEDVSRLRPTLAAAETRGDTPHARAFAEKARHFRRCCLLLAFHGGLWRMMKPLLLALRALRTPAVAHDLRDWDEFEDDPLPEPWCAIPGTLKTAFRGLVAREQQNDPDLDELRRSFGAFCLERLTDRLTEHKRNAALAAARFRKNEEMTEPSAEWRFAYVRAASALRVSAGGKGHHTLHFTAEFDPDPRVRDAARDAEEALRHHRKLPERVSPRRAVLRAVWWLKQAHMRELGEDVDSDGAKRTLEKEFDWAEEGRRADDPPEPLTE